MARTRAPAGRRRPRVPSPRTSALISPPRPSVDDHGRSDDHHDRCGRSPVDDPGSDHHATLAAAPPPTTATTTTVALRASSTASSSTVVTTVAPRAKPSAPRTAVATATGSSGQIRLTWYAPLTNGGSAITDYVIQRSANGGSGWTTIADGVNTSTTYTVNGLANGTRYHFRVYARNAIGSSPAGNVTTATPVNALTAPRSLVAVPTNVSRQLRLTWTAPLSNGGRAITDYLIQRSSNGSTGWTTIADGARVTTAYTVTGLNDGTRYFFRVYARTSTATGPSSTIVNAIPRTKPSAPRSTTAAPNNRLRPGPPDVGGAVVERRRGDHRLPHPTVVERHDVDEHR